MSETANYMNSITQGVYVIGTKKDSTYNLMTAAWLTQISARPNQIAVAISSGHLTAELIKEQKYFSISILESGQKQIAKICGTQSGRTVDKSKLVPYRLNSQGLPVISGSAAQLACKAVQCIDTGDHILVLAEVTGGKVLSDKVLIYDAETYFPS